MDNVIDIAFDCLPLRSVGRVDIPLDASPEFRARLEHLKRAIDTHGVENAYFLYNSRCVFRLANSDIEGMLRFSFEGTVLTDRSDAKAERADIDGGARRRNLRRRAGRGARLVLRCGRAGGARRVRPLHRGRSSRATAWTSSASSTQACRARQLYWHESCDARAWQLNHATCWPCAVHRANRWRISQEKFRQSLPVGPTITVVLIAHAQAYGTPYRRPHGASSPGENSVALHVGGTLPSSGCDRKRPWGRSLRRADSGAPHLSHEHSHESSLPQILALVLSASILATGCQPQQPFYCKEDGDLSHYLDVATEIEYPDVDEPSLDEVELRSAPLTLKNTDNYEMWDLSLEEAVRITLCNSQVMRQLGARVRARSRRKRSRGRSSARSPSPRRTIRRSPNP